MQHDCLIVSARKDSMRTFASCLKTTLLPEVKRTYQTVTVEMIQSKLMQVWVIHFCKLWYDSGCILCVCLCYIPLHQKVQKKFLFWHRLALINCFCVLCILCRLQAYMHFTNIFICAAVWYNKTSYHTLNSLLTVLHSTHQTKCRQLRSQWPRFPNPNPWPIASIFKLSFPCELWVIKVLSFNNKFLQPCKKRNDYTVNIFFIYCINLFIYSITFLKYHKVSWPRRYKNQEIWYPDEPSVLPIPNILVVVCPAFWICLYDVRMF